MIRRPLSKTSDLKHKNSGVPLARLEDEEVAHVAAAPVHVIAVGFCAT